VGIENEFDGADTDRDGLLSRREAEAYIMKKMIGVSQPAAQS
jgi:hypothetical protein